MADPPGTPDEILPAPAHPDYDDPPLTGLPAAVAQRLPLLIISAGVVAYLSSFSGVFLFDDLYQIVDNERIHRLSSIEPLLASRRPVVELSFAVNYAVGRLNTWGYHAANLTIHVLAALTLFGVVRRTLASQTLRGRFGAASIWLAAVVALIWVVHPANTQAVVYLVQRAESLMALFYLLTLYCVIRAMDARRPLGWYALAVVVCALGMGSKAVMISAPIVILLYECIFATGSFQRTLRTRAPFYVALLGTWSVLWLCGVAQGVLGTAHKAAHAGFSFKGISPGTYLLTQFGVVAHYLRLSLWPHPLCLDYGWPTARTLIDVAAPAIVILPLLAATVWALWRRPRLGWVAACFFLILAPTSTFIPIRDPIFEHRLYLSLASLVVVVVIGTHAGVNAIARRLGWRRASAVALATAMVVPAVVLLGRTTFARNRVYGSEVTMWRDAATKRPSNARAHLALGNALLESETRGDEAVAAFRQAAKADPDGYEGFYGLGNALHDQGENADAADAYRQALQLRPGHADSHCALGVVLVELGELDEAERAYANAIAARPNHYQARYNLGNVLTDMGRTEEAIEAYRACIGVSPRFTDAHVNLGVRLCEIGEFFEAEAAFRTALDVDPHHAKAYYNYGLLLANQQHLDKAIHAFRNAVRADPAYANAHHNLGVMLWQQGFIEEATRYFRETLRLEPDHPGALASLRAASAQAKP